MLAPIFHQKKIKQKQQTFIYKAQENLKEIKEIKSKNGRIFNTIKIHQLCINIACEMLMSTTVKEKYTYYDLPFMLVPDMHMNHFDNINH